MIYDSSKCGDGVWHCPFTPEWVEMMKRAATHCKIVTEAQVVATLMVETAQYYEVPPGDFLSEPQDTRGLPLSLHDNPNNYPKCSIYDYETVPDVVVTDGEDDWPYNSRYRILTA